MQPEDVWWKQIICVGGSSSGSLPMLHPDTMKGRCGCQLWTSIIWKQILPCCGVRRGTDRKWQWPLLKDAAWHDLHLFPLNLSVARITSSWWMWQHVSPHKVPRDKEGQRITPSGEEGWGVWRWQKVKRSFVVSTEGYKPRDGWTMKEISADLTPMSSFPIQAPALLFSCPFMSSAGFLVRSVRR